MCCVRGNVIPLRGRQQKAGPMKKDTHPEYHIINVVMTTKH